MVIMFLFRRFWDILGLFFPVILALPIIGLILYDQLHQLPSDPAQATASSIHSLIKLTNELEAGFNTSAKPDDVVRDYLRTLRHIRSTCERVAVYSKQSSKSSRVTQTDALCQDLAKLVSNSETLYQALQPIMITNTPARRYQTLPLFSSLKKRQDTSAVSTALTKLSQPGAIQTDFPTAVLPELKQLQSTMQASKGLDYLPALHTLQLRLLGERQQYWLSYADFDLMQRSLANQLTAYCEDFSTQRIELATCR